MITERQVITRARHLWGGGAFPYRCTDERTFVEWATMPEDGRRILDLSLKGLSGTIASAFCADCVSEFEQSNIAAGTCLRAETVKRARKVAARVEARAKKAKRDND